MFGLSRANSTRSQGASGLLRWNNDHCVHGCVCLCVGWVCLYVCGGVCGRVGVLVYKETCLIWGVGSLLETTCLQGWWHTAIIPGPLPWYTAFFSSSSSDASVWDPGCWCPQLHLCLLQLSPCVPLILRAIPDASVQLWHISPALQGTQERWYFSM